MSAVTTRTGEYLVTHAESEDARVSPSRFEEAVDQTVRGIKIGPESTMADIARICAWFSTPEREVFARIECVNGRPIAYFVRGRHEDFLPGFLRRQAD